MKEATKDLPDGGFALGYCHWFVPLFEPLTHIKVEVLKNEVKFVVTMDNVKQIYDILVLKFPQKCDFADSC